MTGTEVFWIVAIIVGVGQMIRNRFRTPTPEQSHTSATAADACGLTLVGPSTWAGARDGPFHDLLVRFEVWFAGEDNDEERGTRIVVSGRDRGLVGLNLSPETAATARAKGGGAREIETGDDGFDDAFYVTGPSTSVRAVLDGETRRRLRSLLVEVGLEIVNGELRGQVLLRLASESEAQYRQRVSRTLPLLLEAAQRLRRPSDIPARLAHNASADDDPGVRRENLLALARDYPDAPITRETLRTACADPSDGVRVRAAACRGEEGLSTLLELARADDGDDLPAGRAMATLGDRLAIGELKEILGRALRTRRIETAFECLASLGRRADPDGVPVLARVLAVERGELAVAAARALGETGLAVAEPPLLAALVRDLPDLRVAACEALGRVGSAGAVLPLKEIESRYRDDATRRAARQAVAAIQSRLPGASPGQLSLAAADSGGLSLAEDETGRLSLDDDTKK